MVGSIRIRCADKKLVMIQQDINDQPGVYMYILGLCKHSRGITDKRKQDIR